MHTDIKISNISPRLKSLAGFLGGFLVGFLAGFGVVFLAGFGGLCFLA